MQLQWNGTDPTRVRLTPNDEKVEIQPGQVFEVEDEEYARFLLNYHRKVMLEVPEVEEADEPADVPADAVVEKDLPKRANTALTKKQRRTKRA